MPSAGRVWEGSSTTSTPVSSAMARATVGGVPCSVKMAGTPAAAIASSGRELGGQTSPWEVSPGMMAPTTSKR